MSDKLSLIISSLLLLILPMSAISLAQTVDNDLLRKNARSFIGAIPARMPGSESDTKAMIALGEKLYFETALSINNSQSCNSCHNILNGGHGVDNLKTSFGVLGKSGRRNAPSTWNAGFQFAQNWDASASSLKEQAVNPILDPHEMAMPSKAEAVNRLSDYKKEFELAFPDSADSLSFENLTTALASFQRTLITTDRFDNFINGDNSALSHQEKLGFLAFQQRGCASCHSGALMGGQFIMKLGVVKPYPNTSDKGYAEITGRKDHEFLFKVPMLRNVANTAPYFHDGATASLREAVFLTGWHQLGIRLPDEEVDNITAFLGSLNNIRPYRAGDDNELE